MHFGFASQAPRQDRTETSFYADHLLPALQSTLAALADLDTRYKIERDYLEEWSGPDEAASHSEAALNASWQRGREPIVQRLTRLEEQIKAPRPAHRSESMRHKARISSGQDGVARRSAA